MKVFAAIGAHSRGPRGRTSTDWFEPGIWWMTPTDTHDRDDHAEDRATNQSISGTHNRSTIRGLYGAGQEDGTRTEDFAYDADHPAVLVGTGNGPTPVEFLLHAIAACLTAGIANVAAARGVPLRRSPRDSRSVP